MRRVLAILPTPKSSFVSWYLWSRSGLPMLATLISSTRGSSLPRRHCSAGETCALGGKSSVWDCVASSEHSCCSLQNGTDEGFFFSFLLIPIIRGSQLPSRQRLCAPWPFFWHPQWQLQGTGWVPRTSLLLPWFQPSQEINFILHLWQYAHGAVNSALIKKVRKLVFKWQLFLVFNA